MARHIEDLRLMDRTFVEEPNEPEGVIRQDEQTAPVIVPWRYVYAYCPVKGAFAPLKEDWWNWAGQDYIGDCYFYVEYGVEYQDQGSGFGTTAFGTTMTITDQWKKGMKFNTAPDDLKAPCYVLSTMDVDCSDPGLSDKVRNNYCGGQDYTEFAPCHLPSTPEFMSAYDAKTGVVKVTINPTDANHWRCFSTVEILTGSGADLSVFSPKPRVSNTVTDLTTNAKVKPEQMVTDGTHPYELRINMKGFGIKTPALTTQSSWNYVDWWIEGTAWQAESDTGMWVTRSDPGWYIGLWSGPFLGGNPDWCPWTSYEGAGGTYGCWGGAEWYHHNAWANYWQDEEGQWHPSYELYWPPSTGKALFPPSSVGLKFVKSQGISLGPNFDGTDTQPGTQGYLYQFHMYIEYRNKGISFITSNDIAFSGNPVTVRVDTQGRGLVSWNLELYGTYPDRIYA
jgi:hypothetical protein